MSEHHGRLNARGANRAAGLALALPLAGFAAAVGAGGASARGQFSTAGLTGDADSGVSGPQAKYTHAIDWAGEDDAVVNGVTFKAVTGNNPGGANFSTAGFVNTFDNDDTNVTGGIGDALDDFYFTGDGTGNSSLTLTGLTPGQQYVATFYASGFGGAGGRQVDVVPSDTGSTTRIDENQNGNNNGLRIVYTYTSPNSGDGTQTFMFDAVNDSDSFHHYAFTNEVVPEPVGLSLLALGGLGLLARRRRA